MHFINTPQGNTTPITPLTRSALKSFLASQDQKIQSWLKSIDFSAKAGQLAMIPGHDGKLSRILFGIAPHEYIWSMAELPKILPPGTYFLDDIAGLLQGKNLDLAIIGWGLGSYTFDQYKTHNSQHIELVFPPGVKKLTIENILDAIYLVRDLINTPAKDLGPKELAGNAADLAKNFSGDCSTIVGEELLYQGFPAIYAVGASSHRNPLLIDLTWGDIDAPKLTLIGKGVCFDTGGLNLKTAHNMKLMKKDMGGAAHALGLSMAIMKSNLPVRLRTLIPAVDNAVGPRSLKPLDVIKARNGITIEIGHTDAEGRVILADALTLASEEDPDLICDFATLTGAARIALGTDIPALFTNSEEWAQLLLAEGEAAADRLWRLPLWHGYNELLISPNADITNEPKSPYGGAITASLFLERFIKKQIPWCHVDLMGWNSKQRPGRPEGGEAMGLRTFFNAFENYFTPK